MTVLAIDILIFPLSNSIARLSRNLISKNKTKTIYRYLTELLKISDASQVIRLTVFCFNS